MNGSATRYDSEDSPLSIRPLPPVLRHGLAAVVTMGFFSFFTSLGLLLFLTYKLISWHNGPPRTTKDLVGKIEALPTTTCSSTTTTKTCSSTITTTTCSSTTTTTTTTTTPGGGAAFIIPNEWTAAAAAAAVSSEQPEPEKTKETWWQRAINEPPNQFLVLIFNLLLADIQQALAFLLNVEWLTRNAVEVGTGTCWTQGWFISIGDLASSVFITGIAIHTYMSIVRTKQMPTWAFHTAIVMMWGFVYGTGILGVIVTENGKNEGGLYVRAGAWCWINSKYQDIRLALHYLWIFMSLIITTIIYAIIFLHLQQLARKSGGVIPCCDHPPPGFVSDADSGRSSACGSEISSCSTASMSKCSSTSKCSSASKCGKKSQHSSKQPRIWCLTTVLRRLPGVPDYARQHTFLLYPLVYVVCTMPLAAGRLASMFGHEVSLGYFCFAGAMIACNGWMDVVLYSSTRRSIVFSGETPPSQDVGLETFSFMCPQPPKFGNTTTITGGMDRSERKKKCCRKWSEKIALKGSKSGGLKELTVDGTASTDSMKGFGMGSGSVMGMAIQCETVTTVSVEMNPNSEITRPKSAALGRKMSDTSSFSTSSATASRSSGVLHD